MYWLGLVCGVDDFGCLFVYDYVVVCCLYVLVCCVEVFGLGGGGCGCGCWLEEGWFVRWYVS